MQLIHRLAAQFGLARASDDGSPVKRRSLLERAFWRVWRPVDRLAYDVSRDLSFLLMKAGATCLPAGRALKVAGLLSRIAPINTAAPAAVRKAFGVSPAQAREIVKKHRLTPYRDYLMLRKLVLRGGTLEDYPYREQNAEIVRELRDTRASCIIAIGHFSRLATLPLYLSSATPQDLTGLIAPHPGRSWKPGTLWRRIHLGQILTMLQNQVRLDLQLVHPGSLGAIKGIIRKLRSKNNVVITSADAHWTQTDDCHSRPFLGHPVKYFSHGAAWMARTAQCPIVVCMPYLDETGTAVLDWRLRIDPPAKDDVAADERITKQMLDEVEAAVIRHPEQYVLDLTA